MPAKKPSESTPVPAKRATKTAAKKTVKPVETKAMEAPAATHKAPARKKAAKPAAEAEIRKPVAVEVAAPVEFDSAQHHGAIAETAYFLWLERGRVHGYAEIDWLRAVEIVRSSQTA